MVAADGRSLARAVRLAGKVEPLFVEKWEDIARDALHVLRDGDVFMTMGAGSIGQIAGRMMQQQQGDKA